MTTTILKIDGMSCGHCVRNVHEALKSVEGVTTAQVAVGSARVEFDPAIASVEKLAEAISDTGYRAALASNN